MKRGAAMWEDDTSKQLKQPEQQESLLHLVTGMWFPLHSCGSLLLLRKIWAVDTFSERLTDP